MLRKKSTGALLNRVTSNAKFPEEIDAIPKKWELFKEIGKDKKSIMIYYIP